MPRKPLRALHPLRYNLKRWRYFLKKFSILPLRREGVDMWKKWFPWRFMIKKVAQKQGFLDPIALLSKLQRFAQPSEVAAPVELIRLATVLQARGLLNVQAIQHNLDWIWPYWVVRQFNPHDTSFIPRAFSITHINLTHRNWTAVGVPDFSEYPIVDPRGLLTPFYDGWSIDAWMGPWPQLALRDAIARGDRSAARGRGHRRAHGPRARPAARHRRSPGRPRRPRARRRGHRA